LTRHETGSSGGSSYWQVGGGAQMQLQQRNLWLRGEGNASRNVDLLTRDFVPRESFNIGLNGELARGLSFAFNIAADRTPLLFGTGTPWTTRSTVRLLQNFSTGSARVPAATSSVAAAVTRARGTGTILGTVFTDWNANGTRDPEEDPLENIPVRIAGVSSVTSRRDGEFAFLNVPTGPQQVGLDTSAIPVDFDPPAENSVTIELDRGVTRRVSFGLIPLGSVRGRVVRDANNNGRVDPGEEPLEGVVLMLDGGARSEQVRRGNYRFDSIRSGDHVVSLLRESLPEGAVITGATEVPLALKRDQLSIEVDFAVAVEKRPENRRVFPPRGGSPQTAAPKEVPANQPAAKQPASGPPAVRPPQPAPSITSSPGARTTVSPLARAMAITSSESRSLHFAVQVAALLDPLRARALVRELASAGYPAYLMPPGINDPDGPYRIRVGGYRTRAAANAAAIALGRQRNEELWVIRDARRTSR
jgi:cell division septation protein DedD